jgi:hypothetical protein
MSSERPVHRGPRFANTLQVDIVNCEVRAKGLAELIVRRDYRCFGWAPNAQVSTRSVSFVAQAFHRIKL